MAQLNETHGLILRVNRGSGPPPLENYKWLKVSLDIRTTPRIKLLLEGVPFLQHSVKYIDV